MISRRDCDYKYHFCSVRTTHPRARKFRAKKISLLSVIPLSIAQRDFPPKEDFVLCANACHEHSSLNSSPRGVCRSLGRRRSRRLVSAGARGKQENI